MEQKHNIYALDPTPQSGPGTDQYATVGRLMKDITERIKRVSALAFDDNPCKPMQIAHAAQVSDELDAIDESMRQISALVLESTAAVEALEFNADQLAQSLARFKSTLSTRASRPTQSGR